MAGIRDGSTVMPSGFGNAGVPTQLIDALIAQGSRNLTIINNSADTGRAALRRLTGESTDAVEGLSFEELQRLTEVPLKRLASAA